MTQKLWLEIILVCPLIGTLLCALLSPRLARVGARAIALVPLIGCLALWQSVDPTAILALPLTEGVWLPGVPVDFSLGTTPFALPFLLLSQGVACVALWQKSERSSGASTCVLLFAQFCLAVVFTAQDMLLFCAAVQGVWWSTVFSAQMEEEGSADSLVPFALVSGALLLASAVLLGALHLEQFQNFSMRLAALRELNIPQQAVLGDFNIGEIVFGMMALATLLMAPVVPAHLWLQSLLSGRATSAQVIALGSGSSIAVYTWLQWMIPLLPEAYSALSIWLSGALLFSLVYAAALALVAKDLPGWLSGVGVFQNAFALLGLTMILPETAGGSVLHALAWPLAAVGFVCFLAWLEKSFASRRSEDIGSLFASAPRAALVGAVFFLMAIAAPTTGLFPSQLLVLSGLIQIHPVVGVGSVVAWGILFCSMVRAARPLYLSASPHQGIRVFSDLAWTSAAAAVAAMVLSSALGAAPDWVKSKITPALKSYWKVPLKAQTLPQPNARRQT